MESRKQPKDLSKDDRHRLRVFLKGLETFQAYNPTMPIQIAHTFLTVAMHPGRSLREYTELLGLPQSTVSRHLLDLGERNRRMAPGLQLVKREVDPMELRKNRYSLTPQGQILLNTIIKLMKEG